MKASKISLILCIPLLFLFADCSKKDNTPPAPPPPTSLEITFTDNLGNKVSGTQVQLYASQNDWHNGTNQIGVTQISDGNGVVTFTNLSAIKYYWFAQNGCKNNISGTATTQSPLTANVKNTVTSMLNNTGTLKFNNTSSNPYHVYVNGQFIMDMNGGTTQSIDWIPLGSYSIHVVQISGYAISPTDETFSGSISSCGQTLITTFP